MLELLESNKPLFTGGSIKKTGVNINVSYI